MNNTSQFLPKSIPPVNNQNLNMPAINFTTNAILKLLSKLNPQKANGPDKIPIRFLRDYAGDLPQDWLTADVIAIFKKGKKT